MQSGFCEVACLLSDQLMLHAADLYRSQFDLSGS